MQSKAATVDAYLQSLPEDRREALEAIRAVFKRNLDKGYEEGMSYGMIGYYVPHSIYPAGYHCDPKSPLPFAGLASQKNHLSVYMMCLYGNKEQEKQFIDAWKKTGKKLDMGKCCIRGRKLDDFALDVIGEAIKRVTVKKYIEHYEAARSRGSSRTPSKQSPKKSAAKKPTSKKVAKKSRPSR